MRQNYWMRLRHWKERESILNKKQGILMLHIFPNTQRLR